MVFICSPCVSLSADLQHTQAAGAFQFSSLYRLFHELLLTNLIGFREDVTDGVCMKRLKDAKTFGKLRGERFGHQLCAQTDSE